MTQVALRVAPQRNTQYQELARALARPELELSPLRSVIESVQDRAIGDAEYLIIDLVDDDRTGDLLASTLGSLSATSDAFGITDGGWQPIAVTKAAAVPRLLTEARRYSGKTNEVFTRVLVNLATFDRPPAKPGTTRLLDPMCGGGTTLFAALERNCSVVGADVNNNAVDGTAQYLRQFCKDQRIKSTERIERLPNRSKAWHREIVVDRGPLRVSLLQADLGEVAEAMGGVPGGTRCHAVVADLPYGIQHRGEVAELINGVVSVARATLAGDGMVALAWNATRLDRSTVLDGIDLSGFELREGGAYDRLGHRVDRVIRQRDVFVLARVHGAAAAGSAG